MHNLMISDDDIGQIWLKFFLHAANNFMISYMLMEDDVINSSNTR